MSGDMPFWFFDGGVNDTFSGRKKELRGHFSVRAKNKKALK